MVSVSRVLALVVLACAWHAAGARAQARIEGVQYPAWLEREGVAEPLMPGTALRARDAIATGPEGRASLRLAEGTVVRLGEKARIVLQRDELAVQAGAFRLTSPPGRREEVAVRVGQVLVLGRGADLWGETGTGDHVTLVAGQARANAPGQPPVALDRPLDRYEASPGGAAPALGRATTEAMADAVRRVDFGAEGARAAREGRWRVFVGKFVSGVDAGRLRSNVRAAGFPAEVIGGGASPFVVVVAGFAGEAEARAAMALLRGVQGAGILTVNEAR